MSTYVITKSSFLYLFTRTKSEHTHVSLSVMEIPTFDMHCVNICSNPDAIYNGIRIYPYLRDGNKYPSFCPENGEYDSFPSQALTFPNDLISANPRCRLTFKHFFNSERELLISVN